MEKPCKETAGRFAASRRPLLVGGKEIAMNVKIRRPRSCLGYLGWLVAIFFVFVLLYNGYAQVRIALARMQAEGLARELGYIPGSLLSEKLIQSDIGIVTGSYKCSTKLYFVTSLDLPEFEERLQQAKPRSLRIDPFPSDMTDIYYELPLTVASSDGNESTYNDILTPIPTFWWSLRDTFPIEGGTGYLYQTNLAVSIFKLGEELINDNIAVISYSAGRFPFWVLLC